MKNLMMETMENRGKEMDRKDILKVKVQGKEVKIPFVIDTGKNEAFELVLVADGFAFYMNPGDEVFVMDLRTGELLEKEDGEKRYHKTMKEVVQENKAYEFVEISFLLDKATDFVEVEVEGYLENYDPEDEWDRAMEETHEITKRCETLFRVACQNMVDSMHSPDEMGEIAYEEWEKFKYAKYKYRKEERARIDKKAELILEQILLSESQDDYEYTEAVEKINNVEVGKAIIKKLLKLYGLSQRMVIQKIIEGQIRRERELRCSICESKNRLKELQEESSIKRLVRKFWKR